MDSNNNVKHHRREHYKEANLANVLMAMAGLHILLVAAQEYSRMHWIHQDSAKLFSLTDWDGVNALRGKIVFGTQRGMQLVEKKLNSRPKYRKSLKPNYHKQFLIPQDQPMDLGSVVEDNPNELESRDIG